MKRRAKRINHNTHARRAALPALAALRLAALPLAALPLAALFLAAPVLAGGAARAAAPAHPDAPIKADASAKADAFLAPLLSAPRAAGWTPVLLTLTPSSAPGGALRPAQEAALRALGADITRRLPFLSALAARVPTRHLGRLAALPFVARLSWDGPVRKSDEFTCASSGAGAAYAQYALTGQGVSVAVLDSGIWAGGDLNTAGSLPVNAPSFVPNDPGTMDLCGHGTHVAAIVAGNGTYSSGSGFTHTYYGIARKARIVSVRVLDARGQGSVSSVISGLNWAIQNKSLYNIRVINLSLGHPVGESYKTDPLCQAVEAAYKAGIVVVCAAGNGGRASAAQTVGAANEGWGASYGSINSPGNDPYVITVGATKSVDGVRAHDRIATYSGRGPSPVDLVLKPDLIAPGNRVISLGVACSYLMTNYAATNVIPASAYNPYLPGTSQTYFRLSGTSMAAPVAAGAAALLLQADPTLSPDTVKARLMITADKWVAPDGTADPCTYGAGYLNIPAALQSTAQASMPALSPTLTFNAQGVLTLNAAPILSGSHIIWGSTGVSDLHIIWGSTALGAGTSTALTASHIIWGSSGGTAPGSVWNSSVSGSHIIWGSSAVDLTSTAIKGE